MKMKFRPYIFVSCSQIVFTIAFNQFCPISKLMSKMSKISQSDKMRLDMVSLFNANESNGTAPRRNIGKQAGKFCSRRRYLKEIYPLEEKKEILDFRKENPDRIYKEIAAHFSRKLGKQLTVYQIGQTVKYQSIIQDLS